MSDQFLAEIRMFGCNFAPKGWALCNGQLLPISQNTALFSLLGTTYGGDGKSTFALPNLQGMAPLHAGQGPGLSLYDLGQTGGEQAITLLDSEMPAHQHFLTATTDRANTTTSTGNELGTGAAGPPNQVTTGMFYSNNAANTALSFQALAIAGASLPHNNMMPYLTLTFCIAMQGIFPART